MANHYIHVGSITNAMRGKRLLEGRGIHAYLHRATNSVQGDGCGYSLLVTDNVGQAQKILEKGGVRAIRISDAL